MKLGEQVVELTEARDIVNVHIKDRLECAQTVGAFGHRCVVYGVPLVFFVLEGQDVTVPLEYIADILLQQTDQSQLELLVPPNRVRVVLNSPVEFAMFDVHGLHSVVALLFPKLIVHNFFKADSLVVEQRNEAVVVAAVANDVVQGLAVVVKV